MSEINLFEYATRNALRFESSKGLNSLSVEDLWNLPLKSDRNVSLDQVAQLTNKRMHEEQNISFVDEQPSVSRDNTVRMSIVKYIIDVKKHENKTKEAAKERADLIRKLQEIKQQRKEESLSKMSEQELDEMIANLKN